MRYPIRKVPVITEEERLFLIDVYKWLLRNFGGDTFYKKTSLILPVAEFFPGLFSPGETVAETVFQYVRKYAGMKDWPFELKAQGVDPERKVPPSIAIEGNDYRPLGTFSDKNPEKVVITYDPSLTSRPTQLVATFAHELAHYLTRGCAEPPPGGWENWEAATDITAVFMGFGVFMANGVFTFSQYTDGDSHGCRSSQSGYLSEEMMSFALGIFIKLKEIKPYTIYRYLEPDIKSFLIESLKELNESQDCIELSDVKYTPAGP